MFRRLLVPAGVLAGFAFVAPVMLAGSALAAIEKFHATLAGSSEVPPTASKGSGEATASLDTATHELTYDVTFTGLGEPATAAHFHGPAEPGKNAGVVVPLGNAPTSPIHGTAKLTPEQQQQLTAGHWYVNVHTKTDPGGAIRGQMTPAK
jgi:hypothetical protein